MSVLRQAAETPTTEVAARLGFEAKRHASSLSVQCPACGSPTRHTKSGDKRGAVGIKQDGSGWRCFQCDAGGDGLDFASCALKGRRFRELETAERDEVLGWFAFGDEAPRQASRRTLDKKRLSPAWENADVTYPPLSEVEAVWQMCRPLGGDSEVSGYLASRGISDVSRLDEHEAAKAWPANAPGPAWAAVGDRGWGVTGHRLIVPLYDHVGRMRSVLARSVERQPAIKSVGAKGYQRRGLVIAGTYGREMLMHGARARMHLLEQFRLSVWEGEIDTLRAIASGQDDLVYEGFQPAACRGVLGVMSGSFTRDVAARVPSKSVVVIATDDDEAGDAYAEQIRESLGKRVSFERHRPQKD